MKKITSNQLKNHVGRIILIRSKEINLKVFLSNNGPATGDHYHVVSRYYLLNSANTKSITVSFLNLFVGFGSRTTLGSERKIAISDLEKAEVSYFSLTKKEVSKIKEKILFDIERVENTITFYQKIKKELHDILKIF